MKRITSLIFCFIFLAALTTANAQDIQRTGGQARIYSMGNNPYIIDPEFIKLNPAWASDYYNFLWGDIGSNAGAAFGDNSNGQFAGLNVRINSRFTVGGLVTVNTANPFVSISTLDPYGLVQTINNVIGINRVVPLNNNFEALASLKYGRSTFGLGIAYAATQNEFDRVGQTAEIGDASQFGINAGMLSRLTGNITIDAGISLIFPSASYQPVAGNNTKLSQTIILFDARSFINVSRRLAFVPLITLQSASGSMDAGGSSGDLPSLFNFRIGAGANYKIDEFLLAGGIGVEFNSQKTPSVPNVSPELTNSSVEFPVWNLGAEWIATKWLVARLGYMASTNNSTTETTYSTTQTNQNIVTSYSPGTVTLGIGLRFGGFSLDATVNSDVIRQGLNIIGGGGPTFAYVSTSYAF
jgi:hypothetical protein